MQKEWKYGLHRLSQSEIGNLDFPDGILLDIVPSESSIDSIAGMQKVLYMMQNYPCRFSFEIWKDKKISFHFFTSSKSTEGMLKSQLLSIYPQVTVRKSKTSLSSLTEGEYVSSCKVVLTGSELDLRCPENFHYDPLRHIIESMNLQDSKVVVQVLFERLRRIPKDKRVKLTQKYGDDLFFRGVGIPVLKCLVRIVAISADGFKARVSCEHVARTFSVFDSDKSRLSTKMVSYPIFRNSMDVLAGMNLREFPLFSDSFMISIPELASMVHLPVSGIPGVEYSQPSLSNPW